MRQAGGVALNLTEASRVFLMDPWWNPGTVLVSHPFPRSRRPRARSAI